jgi:hypothetical protein
MTVYGFGEQKTPEPFVAACDKFVYTEILREDADRDAPTRKSGKELKRDTRLVTLIRSALNSAADEAGWAHLGAVGSAIAKRSPEFDSRNYGYAKLSGLLKAVGFLETEERTIGKGPHKTIYVRDTAGPD